MKITDKQEPQKIAKKTNKSMLEEKLTQVIEFVWEGWPQNGGMLCACGEVDENFVGRFLFSLLESVG